MKRRKQNSLLNNRHRPAASLYKRLLNESKAILKQNKYFQQRNFAQNPCIKPLVSCLSRNSSVKRKQNQLNLPITNNLFFTQQIKDNFLSVSKKQLSYRQTKQKTQHSMNNTIEINHIKDKYLFKRLKICQNSQSNSVYTSDLDFKHQLYQKFYKIKTQTGQQIKSSRRKRYRKQRKNTEGCWYSSLNKNSPRFHNQKLKKVTQISKVKKLQDQAKRTSKIQSGLFNPWDVQVLDASNF